MSTGQQFDKPDKVSTEKVDAVRGAGRSIVRGFAWLRSRSGAVVLVATVVAFVVVALVRSSKHRTPSESNAVRLSLGLPSGLTLHRNWHPFEHLAVSPDGETLAFAATDASGQSSLWIRPLDSSEARRMDHTERALLPFWSPDSQFIGFWADGKLKKIRRSGGSPEVIFSVPEIAQGTWGPRRDDSLRQSRKQSNLPRVSKRRDCDSRDLVAPRTGQPHVGPIPAGWQRLHVPGADKLGSG